MFAAGFVGTGRSDVFLNIYLTAYRLPAGPGDDNGRNAFHANHKLDRAPRRGVRAVFSRIMLGIAMLGFMGVGTVDIYPPEVFRGEAVALVRFVPADQMVRYCGEPPAGMDYMWGCVSPDRSTMTVPNPCEIGMWRSSEYRARFCHELGHVNGWDRDHPQVAPAGT